MAQKCSQSEQEEFWVSQRTKWSYLMVTAYDGTEFYGFQAQNPAAKLRTISGALFKMLTTLLQVDAKSLSLGVRVLCLSCTRFVCALNPLICDSCSRQHMLNSLLNILI